MKNIFPNPTESVFPNLSEEELLSRIRDFRRNNTKDLSDEELFKALNGLFLGTGETHYSFPMFSGNFAPGQQFFRVRYIPDDDCITPLKGISSISDAWEPPTALVSTNGRVNRIGKPVLYTCAGNPLLAFQETNAQKRKHFCLFVYEAKRKIKCATIGSDVNLRNYSETNQKLLQHMYDFFETEFTRDVGRGSEHLYRISIEIAETFYSYPDQDAWCYRSCVDRSKFNCAFMYGRAESSLKLKGGMICRSEEAILGNINVKMIIDFSSSSVIPTFHDIGSERQIALFPEIRT